MTTSSSSSASTHLDEALLTDWAVDALPDLAAWTVEEHLVGCAICRDRLGEVDTPVADAELAGIYARVATVIAAPDVSVVERALQAVGVSESTARLLMLTRSFTFAWLASVAVVTAGMLILGTQLEAAGARWDGLGLFLAVAPIVPLAGVAMSFGAHTDPTHELLRAAPMSAVHLLVVRTAAVLATTVVPMVVASAVAPEVGLPALAAVLPSCAVVAVALGLSPTVSAPAALTVTLGGWVGVLAAISLFAQSPQQFVPGAAMQVGCVVVIAAATANLVRRRHDLDVVG